MAEVRNEMRAAENDNHELHESVSSGLFFRCVEMRAIKRVVVQFPQTASAVAKFDLP